MKILDFGLAQRSAAPGAADATRRRPSRHRPSPAPCIGTRRLHGARAGARRAGRPPRRHLRLRRDALRDADRPARRSGARTPGRDDDAILSEEPRRRSAHASRASRGLERIVRHCLEKAPTSGSSRPATSRSQLDSSTRRHVTGHRLRGAATPAALPAPRIALGSAALAVTALAFTLVRRRIRHRRRDGEDPHRHAAHLPARRRELPAPLARRGDVRLRQRSRRRPRHLLPARRRLQPDQPDGPQRHRLDAGSRPTESRSRSAAIATAAGSSSMGATGESVRRLSDRLQPVVVARRHAHRLLDAGTARTRGAASPTPGCAWCRRRAARRAT